MKHIQPWCRKELLLILCCYLLSLGGCYSTNTGLVEEHVRPTLTTTDHPMRSSDSMVQTPKQPPSSQSEDQSKGTVFRLPNKEQLYSASYALLIGVSDYTAGWSDLGSVPRELEQVKAVLKKQGFEVFLHLNPNSRQLKNLFEDFVGQYGYIPGNRLLFFFSGHGHTRKDGEKGYIVPADTPKSEQDEIGFLTKAVSMTDILAWARKIEAKHALFLFDSCFSGMIFKSKSLPTPPQTSPQIKNAMKLPVRQFITAGSADNAVPAKSIFTPAFVDALKHGWGDINEDGYILGTELGLYLNQKVPESSPQQIPQYGKIPDYDLSRGDFVFFLDKKRINGKPRTSKKSPITILADASKNRIVSNKPKRAKPSETSSSSIEKGTIYLSLQETNKGRHFSIQPLAQLYQEHGFKIVESPHGAEYVLEGKLTVTSSQPIQDTSLRSRHIDLDIIIRSRSDNRIVKRINTYGVSPHIDEFRGAKVAFRAAIQKVETELFSLP